MSRPAILFAVIAAASLVGMPVPAALAAGPAKPALSVTTVTPQALDLPVRVSANGGIAAWQEAVVGAEVGGLRLLEVRADVGDRVRRGDLLARFAAQTVEADMEEARARQAEAEANLAEAVSDARRARELRAAGFVSEQRVVQAETLENAARARLEAQKAVLRAQQIRLEQTRVLAPDDGIVSARSATPGAVPGAGQELFRLIRQGRLEWRAEVPAAELARVRAGQIADLVLADGTRVRGKVRMLGPTVDAQTRNGLVYVDLPAGPARAGMFARGEISIGRARGLTLPESALLLREGFSYTLKLGPDSRVSLVKLAVGRRVGGRVEITAGLGTGDRVVAAGGAFLADGDLVRVVDAPPR